MMLAMLTCVGKAIIPVKTFPKVVCFEGKTYYNADVATCVKAGYRMLPDEPVTPTGKRVKTREVIQDPDKTGDGEDRLHVWGHSDYHSTAAAAA